MLGSAIGSFGTLSPVSNLVFRQKKHPRVSDKEFLVPCKAGTNPKIALWRKIVAEQAGADPEMIRTDTRFVEDLGFD